MKKQSTIMSQRSAVTEVTVIDSHFDNFRDYIDIIQVYQCRICGYHSPLRHAIASHMSEVHFPKTCYLCQLCQFVYEDKSQLRHHITTTHATECSDEAVRYEATINPPSIILPPGFVPNGIPYAQLRHYEDPTAPVVLGSHDASLNSRERGNIPCDGFPVNNFATSDASCSNGVNGGHSNQPVLCHPERDYIQQSTRSADHNKAITVKKEPSQSKTKKTEDEKRESNAMVSNRDSQNDNNGCDKEMMNNQSCSQNTVMGHSSDDSTTDSKKKDDKVSTVSTEQEKQEKRKGKTKVHGKPSLSAVLTNLAAQHKQAEMGNRKGESPEPESTTSEGYSENARKEDSDRKAVQTNFEYSPAQTSHGDHFIPGHFLTYKRAQSVGLPPKKIKLEIIENPGVDSEQRVNGSRHDGPYNADGSFDYYTLTGWKAYQCELCNKGKRGRRVSFKTAQELAEHGYFVHGKSVPLPMPSNSDVSVDMIGDAASRVQSDPPGQFDMYQSPVSWPPPPGLNSHEEAQRRVGLRSMPVLDLSVPASVSSTEGGSGSGSDVNGDENSVCMSDERDNNGQGNEDDDDTHSDDSRSTIPANDAMRLIAYNSENSERNDSMEFTADYHRESVNSTYMGHKVRKTFSSRLAALQRGEISRKKDPKFDESIIKSSYNADGSFDYFSLTGWKAYKCELCKKRRFKTATELAEHKRAMHPGMEASGEAGVSVDGNMSVGTVDKPQTSDAEGAG